MNGNSDFVIENGVLKEYHGPGGDVVIPEEVKEIYRGIAGASKESSEEEPATSTAARKKAYLQENDLGTDKPEE